MKLLVACTLPDWTLDELSGLGVELVNARDVPAEKLTRHMKGVAILIVDRRRVSPEVIAAGDGLQMIVRAGAYCSNIAVEEASNQGVFVSNCPYTDAPSIAELVMGLAVALDRRVPENAAAVRAGQPMTPDQIDARGLTDRTLGILGFGPTGRHVADLARAFRMKILAWSPSLESQSVPGVEWCAFPRELARRSDVVYVHGYQESYDAPLVESVFLENMRPGSLLVHVGFAGVLDETAVAHAVESGRIRIASDLHLAAGDTGRAKLRLTDVPGSILTQRLAGSTEQARAAVAAEVARVVRHFLVTGEAMNVVNLLERSPATWQLVLRLRDTVGVMASIMDAIRTDGINAEEITSRVFSGARAVACSIALDERPSNETLEAIRRLPGVLHSELRAVM
jgi:D-3-phosphoglycerate dehydrogenase